MTVAATLLPALLGLGTGLSLIIAIGAQNAYLLRQGIQSRALAMVPLVLVCALSDAVLIAAGVAGIGGVVAAFPVALVVIRVVGSGFLIVYGVLAARRVFRPEVLMPDSAVAPAGMRNAILTMLALTWLNPHVYLDTVVFIGSVANHQGVDARWWFAGGAVVASFAWFSALGFGARLLRRFFARALSWRILDAIIAVVMLGIGLRLAIGG